LSENELLRLLSQYRLDGVISTGTGAELFGKALEAVRAGQVWIDNGKIKSILHSRASTGNTSAKESFSKREREIVLSIAEGRTNRQIAAHLNISEQTVKTHVSRILKKANVISRAQLGHIALKFKLQSVPLPRMNPL
jgi:DNA-binding NarL/FixJ family response regulator